MNMKTSNHSNIVRRSLLSACISMAFFCSTTLSFGQITDPTDIANLQLWLDAGTGVTTDTGGVRAWADQSGNSRDATMLGIPSLQPTLVPNAINGEPVVRSSGSDHLQIADFTYGTSAISYFAVLSFADFGETIFSHRTSGTDQQAFLLQTNPTTGVLRMFVYPDDGNGDAGAPREVLSTTGISLNTPVIVEARFHNNTIEFGINGELLATTVALNNTVNSLLNADSRLGVGTFYTGNNYGSNLPGTQFEGDNAETLFFDSNVTGSDRQGLINYLGNKYDITVIPDPNTFILVGICGIFVLLRGRGRSMNSVEPRG
jgi:hypothetical protein